VPTGERVGRLVALGFDHGGFWGKLIRESKEGLPMLQISTNKIARVIIRARERDGKAAFDASLKQYIADMNRDEQASLVAVMWRLILQGFL